MFNVLGQKPTLENYSRPGAKVPMSGFDLVAILVRLGATITKTASDFGGETDDVL